MNERFELPEEASQEREAGKRQPKQKKPVILWSTRKGSPRSYKRNSLKASSQVKGYPTHEQMKELWKAFESKQPGAIAEVLRRRQLEKEHNRQSGQK